MLVLMFANTLLGRWFNINVARLRIFQIEEFLVRATYHLKAVVFMILFSLLCFSNSQCKHFFQEPE
jgi:hypothetical protein